MGELTSLDQTLLAVALATLRPAELVFLDQAERGLDGEQLEQLMTGLVGLVASGTCVVVSVLDAADLPDGTDRCTLSRGGTATAPAESATIPG